MKEKPAPGRLARRTATSLLIARAGAAIAGAAATAACVWSRAAETAAIAWSTAQSDDFHLRDPE